MTREKIYRDNPGNNRMANVNTFMTGFIAGAAAGFFPFFLWGISEGSWEGPAPIALGLIAGPALGIIAGGIMAFNPRARSAFRDNSSLYYLAPAFAGAVSIPIFIYIWRN